MNLVVNCGLPGEKALVKLLRQIHKGLNRLRSRMSTNSCDMFSFCTHGEMDYLVALNGIPSSIIEGWLGM